MLKLSIAIPTYNRVYFLKETLKSILPQMAPQLEIVISDNGSTDNTLEMLKEYPQVRVVGFKSNQGIDHNIVNVIQCSLGEYVFLFSDDDILLPFSLDKILEEIETMSPVMICLNHFAFKNHNLNCRQPPFLSTKRKRFSSGSAFFKSAGLGFLSSLIFKRQEALQYVSSVRFGKECAHLEIASRIALHELGTYVVMGDVSVAGRSLETPRYDMIRSCVIYPKEVYDRLLEEALLDKRLYSFFVRRLLYRDMPRIVYKLIKIPGFEFSSIKQPLEEECRGLSSSFKILLWVINKSNKNFLNLLFSKAFFLIQLYRFLKKITFIKKQTTVF